MSLKKWLDSVWQTAEYAESKKISFDLIDSFLNFAPQRILDIGCGLAFESERFQRQYNSDLYLLDGDFDTTADQGRDRKYGTADTMQFYCKISDLQNSFAERRMRYHFVDAHHVALPETLKFDLIYSNVSCGYHYPLATYLDVMRKHSDNNTVMIFDLHQAHVEEQVSGLFEILECKPYPDQKKIAKYRLKLL